jgi:hypothetical protein
MDLNVATWKYEGRRMASNSLPRFILAPPVASDYPRECRHNRASNADGGSEENTYGIVAH